MSEQLSVGDLAGNHYIRHRRTAEAVSETEDRLFKTAAAFSAAIGSTNEPLLVPYREIDRQIFDKAHLEFLDARDSHFIAHDEYARQLKFAKEHYNENQAEYQILAAEDVSRAGIETSFGPDV